MPIVRFLRVPMGTLAVMFVLGTGPAHGFEFTPSWGYAYIDDQPFNDPSTGALLPSTQAWPRGYIRDVGPPDGKDVRIRVWAFDSNGRPLASYQIDEGDFQNKPFDRRLDVAPGVIPYMRFDFCVFNSSGISCLPSHYIGRPDPPPPPPPDDDPPPGGTAPADADGDGHVASADCDDRNSRVYPGAAEVPGNGIDDDCDGGDRPGRVTAVVQSAWTVDGARTRLTRLRVLDAPPGAAVDVACDGRGCPFRARSFGVGAAGNVRLKRLFTRRLRPGAKIELRITAPNAVGKVVRYAIRRDRLPRIRRLCLPPGGTKPGRC